MGHRPSAMESMAVNPTFWKGRSVLITGHTGFKGSWLSLWLSKMGAQVHGYALAPAAQQQMFGQVGVKERLSSNTFADIRDLETLERCLSACRPEIVLHLAAQSLVRESYRSPLETYAVNVLGTANLLDAVRRSPSVKALINVTTDKCYENREWVWPYREGDALGGFDPYSSSKACAEIVTAAYRRSFLDAAGVGLATARAGNVIGGGDASIDRLLPDFFRAIDEGRPAVIRSPRASRPWQHVLEPLAGYLLLAEQLFADRVRFSEAWNFGPADEDCVPVQWIVDYLCQRIEGASWMLDQQQQPHEASALKLDSSKARAQLNWTPVWRLPEALQRTLDWHLALRAGEDLQKFSLQQIAAYELAASAT